jgi:hypothetical protein
MTTISTKKKPAAKKPARKTAPSASKKTTAEAAAALEGGADVGEETVVTPRAKRARKAPSEPKTPAAPPRVTTVHGPTTVHHGDDADRATVDRVLPILEALQVNKHVVPYLLACSEGAMHLSIALPGQNVPYADLPGLTLTVDPYTLDVRLDAIPLGPLDVDLLEIGGTTLLECLRAEPGGEITPLGWRKDWQPHLAMMAGVVADAHAATRN